MKTTIIAPAGYASAIELRLLGAHQSHLVHRLAVLDDAPDLEGSVLVAIIDGRDVAALSLDDQRVVADPFVPTSDAVALLRHRAAQLSNGHRRPPVFRRALRSVAIRPA